MANVFLKQQEEKTDKKSLVPTGAGIAIICFFLPWIKFSCGPGITKTASGQELGGIFWLVFTAAILILGSFIFFKYSGEIKNAKPFALWGSLVAIGIIIFKYIEFRNGATSDIGFIKPEDLGLTIAYGGYGTLVGFLLSLYGSFDLE